MSKQQVIEDYINTIIGGTVSTTALVQATNCSLPTVLSYIKNNPSRFEKVKRGTYLIKASTVTSVSNTDTNDPIAW
jgi:hypothetical protein